MTDNGQKTQDANEQQGDVRQPDDQDPWHRGYAEADHRRDRSSPNPHFQDDCARCRLAFALEHI
jgi:hypothetical protein